MIEKEKENKSTISLIYIHQKSKYFYLINLPSKISIHFSSSATTGHTGGGDGITVSTKITMLLGFLLWVIFLKSFKICQFIY